MRQFAMILSVAASVSAPAMAQHRHRLESVGEAQPFTVQSMGTFENMQNLLKFRPFLKLDVSCSDTEKRLSYQGYRHCQLHPQYQVAFAKWNCKCFSGQCRPTNFRQVSIGSENETGIEVEVDGTWRPVPAFALRKERATMSEDLLSYEAHVCAGPAPKYFIECAWINMPA